MSEENVPVLVVGGGIVGLSAAVFLRAHGVPVMVAERHPGPSMLAKARVLSPRTMEVYRGHGLEKPVRDAPPSVFLHATDAVRAATLSGPEDHRDRRPPGESVAGISPCPPALIEQSTVEPLVRARAVELGAEVRFHTEVGEVRQDADGVTATLTDRGSGRRTTVRARYLVAADGHRSPIRQALGIATRGSRPAQVVNIAFEADLSAALRDRPVGLAYLSHPVPGTLLARLDAADRWVLMVPYHPERGESPLDFTASRCLDAVRAAVGEADLPVRLLPAVPGGERAVHTWELASWVAEEYRRDRILLVGDAVHVMPPSGGLGANTGVQDAHNLAWKLAAVLDGRADEALLDTYEAERRPVAELTCALSTRLHEKRAGGGAGDVAARVHRIALGTGYRYPPAPVRRPLVGELPYSTGDSDALDVRAAEDALTPGLPGLPGLPGSRAPHVPVERAGRPCSTLDLYGLAFTLVLGPAVADAEAEAAAEEAPASLPGLVVLRVGSDLTDPTDGWPRAHGVTRGGAVLVRPDGFLLWRATTWGPSSAGELRDAVDGLLRRPLSPAGR
ncbi:FAD-dependent monooxygenase [Streptomyces sp. NPDC017993]|uniref:FAD-dependent monooxygenase n=1 Tax=Streptomyces sp. NPDC017993 TaxID=3365027 RepID=UPI0037B5D1DF